MEYPEWRYAGDKGSAHREAQGFCSPFILLPLLHRLKPPTAQVNWGGGGQGTALPGKGPQMTAMPYSWPHTLPKHVAIQEAKQVKALFAVVQNMSPTRFSTAWDVPLGSVLELEGGLHSWECCLRLLISCSSLKPFLIRLACFSIGIAAHRRGEGRAEKADRSTGEIEVGALLLPCLVTQPPAPPRALHGQTAAGTDA